MSARSSPLGCQQDTPFPRFYSFVKLWWLLTYLRSRVCSWWTLSYRCRVFGYSPCNSQKSLCCMYATQPHSCRNIQWTLACKYTLSFLDHMIMYSCCCKCKVTCSLHRTSCMDILKILIRDGTVLNKSLFS